MKAIGIVLVVVAGLIATAYVSFQEGKASGKTESDIAEAWALDRQEKIAAGWTPVMIDSVGRETLIPPPPPRPTSKTHTFQSEAEEKLRLHQEDINTLIRQMQVVQNAICGLESLLLEIVGMQ